MLWFCHFLMAPHWQRIRLIINHKLYYLQLPGGKRCQGHGPAFKNREDDHLWWVYVKESYLISTISGNANNFICILRPTKSINRWSFESDIDNYSTGNWIKEFDYHLQMYWEKKWQIQRAPALFTMKHGLHRERAKLKKAIRMVHWQPNPLFCKYAAIGNCSDMYSRNRKRI